MPLTRRPTCTRARGPHPVALVLLVALAIAALATGCTLTVYAPDPPADPRDVYIVDNGAHPSLAMTTRDGDVEVYGYGDRAWYALGQQDIFTGAAALLWETPGSLGRHFMVGPVTEAQLRALPNGSNVTKIVVSGALVDRLLIDLDHAFRARRDTAIYNKSLMMWLVDDPQPYTLCRNSTHRVIDWLNALGCIVKGASFIATFDLKTRDDYRAWMAMD